MNECSCDNTISYVLMFLALSLYFQGSRSENNVFFFLRLIDV